MTVAEGLRLIQKEVTGLKNRGRSSYEGCTAPSGLQAQIFCDASSQTACISHMLLHSIHGAE